MCTVLRAFVRSKLLSHFSVYGGVVMLSCDPRKRAGLSRVEVLAVLLVLVTASGVLLPGCAQHRVPAQRIECANNLRNIGFAMQNYDSAYGYLPCENPVDNPDYKTPPVPSFYAQLCDNLEMASCLKDGDPQKPIPTSQVRFFICPSRRKPMEAPGGRDYGYLKSSGSLKAVLDTPKVSVQKIKETIGTAETALLGHVWVSPDSYKQQPANPSWAAPYPAHAMTNSSRIYEDKDPAGTNALGTAHPAMPAVFADNHIGNLPLDYPQLAALFSIAPRPEPLKNVP
jgi:hypothetical protein